MPLVMVRHSSLNTRYMASSLLKQVGQWLNWVSDSVTLLLEERVSGFLESFFFIRSELTEIRQRPRQLLNWNKMINNYFSGWFSPFLVQNMQSFQGVGSFNTVDLK